MVKSFCDRCGREKTASMLHFQTVSLFPGAVPVKELCSDCYTRWQAVWYGFFQGRDVHVVADSSTEISYDSTQ